MVASFFTDSQAQFNESQKKFTQLWDESQKKLMESQKKLIQSWTSSLPDASAQADFSKSFEKTLEFQRELIDSALNAQQTTMALAIETQKQLWDSYFQATQSMAQK